VELIGTAGSVELEVGRGIELYTGEGHRHIPSDASDDPLRTELETFLAGIRAGRSVAPVTPDDALQGIVAAERIVAALA
jgi:predicted dehydrogenase